MSTGAGIQELTLNTETVRSLSEGEMREVDGGCADTRHCFQDCKPDPCGGPSFCFSTCTVGPPGD